MSLEQDWRGDLSIILDVTYWMLGRGSGMNPGRSPGFWLGQWGEWCCCRKGNRYWGLGQLWRVSLFRAPWMCRAWQTSWTRCAAKHYLSPELRKLLHAGFRYSFGPWYTRKSLIHGFPSRETPCNICPYLWCKFVCFKLSLWCLRAESWEEACGSTPLYSISTIQVK